jgi:hypothetical protein
MGMWSDLYGTTKAYVRLTDSSGNLLVRNADGNADAAITASTANISGDLITLNSDGASGADRKYIIQRPASGMGGDVTLTLPVDDGTAAQVLATDGNGVLSWASAASTALCDKVNHTHIVFGDGTTTAMFTTGAADVINCIEIIVDTVFDGTGPVTMSIGIEAGTSKYAATTDSDLTAVGVYQIHPGIAAAGAESLIITFVKATGSPSTGAARVNVYYATPA